MHAAALQNGGTQDWKNFVQSLSGKEISRAWDASRVGSPDLASAVRARTTSTSAVNAERRKSLVARLQREINQDAQMNQVRKDPGVEHQDLLARAAHAIIGMPPEGSALGLRPGSIVPGTATSTGPAETVRPVAARPDLRKGSLDAQSQTSSPAAQSRPSLDSLTPDDHSPASQRGRSSLDRTTPRTRALTPLVGAEGQYRSSIDSPVGEEQPAQLEQSPVNGEASVESGASDSEELVDESSYEDDSSDDDNESPSEGNQQTSPVHHHMPLEVVREEDEDSNSAEGSSRRVSRAYSQVTPLEDISSLQKEVLPRPVKQRSEPGLPNVAKQLPVIFPTPSDDEHTDSTSQSSAYDQSSQGSHGSKEKHEGIDAQGQGPSVQEWKAKLTLPNKADESAPGSQASEDELRVDDSSADESDDAQKAAPPVYPLPLPPKDVKIAGVEAEASEVSSDEESKASEHSARTGKNTVTFDKEVGDSGTPTGGRTSPAGSSRSLSRSIERSASMSSGSRPATLSRRLSDLSLGTTFGLNGLLRPRSRSSSSSSRRMKLNGDEAQSDDDGDEELKARIKVEQERLRNMKVGEDFFGGSLSTLLDKFDNTDWSSAGTSNTIGSLGLEVGTNPVISPSTKRDSISAEDVLALNAQERINEVRRMRSGASATRSPDNEDAKTIDSALAPSFAALWLLNQAGGGGAGSIKGKEPSTPASPATITQFVSGPEDSKHRRTASGASSEHPTVTHGDNAGSGDSSRLRRLFGSPRNKKSLPAPELDAEMDAAVALRSSVLDRPRPRKPRPSEMGGYEIARGRLEPDARPAARKDEVQVEDTRSTLDNIWRGPLSDSGAETNASAPVMSKHKPAPAKSAIKGGNTPKSFADTLFSFSPTAQPSAVATSKGKSKERVDVNDMGSSDMKDRAHLHTDAEESSDASATDRSRGHKEESAAAATLRASSEASNSNDADSKHRISVEVEESPAKEVFAASDARANSSRSAETGSRKKKGQSIQRQPHSAPIPVQEEQDDMPVRSPPPVSEGWSGESATSTGGPATPSVSDILEQRAALDHTVEPARSAQSKILPLPPMSMSEIPDTLSISAHTQLNRADASVEDNNKTPVAEAQEPQFGGVNLIPPTPPAVTDSQQFAVKSAGGHQADVSSKSTLQRSTSSRSKNSLKKEDSQSRKGVSKRKSMSNVSYTEYQGRGLSLPPGLIATTVASSASRRHSTDPSLLASVAHDQAQTPKPSVERRKSKEKRASRSSKSFGDRPPVPSMPTLAEAEQPMQRTLSENLASLAPPSVTGYSEGSAKSQASDSFANSRSASPDPSPTISVSGQSSVMSSSAPSETSSSRGRGPQSSSVVPPPIPRKIRTVSPGSNGHARTSLMSAISEWESSPIDVDTAHSRNALPKRVTSPHISDGSTPPNDGVPASSVARSQSSVYSGPSPSMVRNAPIGAPTAAILGRATENRDFSVNTAPSHSASLDGHGLAAWRGSFIDNGSEMSHDRHSEYSHAGMPNVPQSSYRAKDPLKASNTIDDRLYAKTTMTTISVTSGAFRNKGLRQRRLSSAASHSEADLRNQNPDGATDGNLLEELSKTTMSLTSHTPPPRKLSSTQVLVQIIACALDEMDRMILRERVRGEHGYGFVPGRSFCGRVMETGWEVKRLRKGDVIFGLQSSKKCGALSEFMTIEQDLVAKAPDDCLTMEQISALPSVGVLSHQLVVNHCSQLPRGARILILHAHDGVGLLTLQHCASLGLIIVAHCPQHVSDGVAICEANGAHEVIVGEPLWALNTLHESSFDLVIDTIGGRRIYDAARRIIAFEGQFCTCFGDLHSSTANPNLRSHLRSLRRSFFKKDTKRIGYEWVGTDTAEDCREALEAVRRAAEEGQICPRLKSVLNFPEAPRAFESTLRGSSGEGDEPGAIVVRIM